MPLVSKHATGEDSSPFYLKNKEKSEEYEAFIEVLGGQTNGNYNAYSYNLLSTVEGKARWKLVFRKATFSSTGNLLLSSKSQTQLELAQWSSENLRLGIAKFTIRKRSWSDAIMMALNSNLKELPGFKHYVIRCKETNHDVISRLTDVLSDLFKQKLVFAIEYNSPNILVDLRTGEIHKKEISELVNF